MKRSACIALLMMLLLMSMPAASQATVFYNPDTNHWYELVDATPTQEYWAAAGYVTPVDGAVHWRMWSVAQERAVANGGYLVTINDAVENQWLVNTFQGLVTTYNNEGNLVRSGVHIGLYQADTTNEPAGGWTWISGSTNNYRNWLPSKEPNNAGGFENWGAMYLALGWERNGYWLDVPAPYGKFDYGQWRYGIAEYETNPYSVPIPPAVWLLGSGLLGIVVIRRRFRK